MLLPCALPVIVSSCAPDRPRGPDLVLRELLSDDGDTAVRLRIARDEANDRWVVETETSTIVVASDGSVGVRVEEDGESLLVFVEASALSADAQALLDNLIDKGWQQSLFDVTGREVRAANELERRWLFICCDIDPGDAGSITVTGASILVKAYYASSADHEFQVGWETVGAVVVEREVDLAEASPSVQVAVRAVLQDLHLAAATNG